MTEKPLVSVIINCYNGEKYLREAIDSVMAQTYENWELVFWDNQSTDSTREIVESYKNPKIHYYYASEHTPLGEARNLAVEKANGEYINFLDADDVWMPEKLEKQIALVKSGVVEVVYTGYSIIADSGTINKKLFYSLDKEAVLKHSNILDNLLEDNFIIFSSVLFNKSLFVKVGGIDGSFKQNEDYDILLKCAIKTEFGGVPEKLTKYRIHASNSTSNNKRLGLYENRIIFSKLPNSKTVKKAIVKNETRISLDLIVNYHFIEGIKNLITNGSIRSLITIFSSIFSKYLFHR